MPNSETSHLFQPELAPRDVVLKLEREAKEAQVATEMPRYQCHKKVWALKIAQIIDPTEERNQSDGSRVLVPAEAGYAPFRVPHEYVHKHNPHVGGYYVVYDDGYKSFSPASAFETGYTRIP
jgi:hypothetical protein